MAPILFNIISQPTSAWNIVSRIIGWSYFFVWSVSFYPQAYLNWKRKSVRGLSIDFLFYNVLGFFCYSIYNLELYYNEEIKNEYRQRHPHSTHSLVRFNDVVFSIHGFILSLFILLQTCVYKKHESQKISSFAAAFVWLAVMGAVLVVSTVHYGGAIWLDFMYYLSFVKLTVSFIKYLPQVWLNYKRRSTQGWSIQYIIWDLSGGLLSIMQLLLDAYLADDWSGVEGDNVKLGLGIIVICYDIVFLIQHYLLYPHRHPLIPIVGKHTQSRLGSQDRTPVLDNDSASEVSSVGSRRPRNHYGSTSHTPSL